MSTGALSSLLLGLKVLDLLEIVLGRVLARSGRGLGLVADRLDRLVLELAQLVGQVGLLGRLEAGRRRELLDVRLGVARLLGRGLVVADVSQVDVLDRVGYSPC